MIPSEIQKLLADLTAEKHSGTVADRQAHARIEAGEVRLQRDLRKAEANRIRVKIRSLESSIMAAQTQAKLLQAEMKL